MPANVSPEALRRTEVSLSGLWIPKFVPELALESRHQVTEIPVIHAPWRLAQLLLELCDLDGLHCVGST